MSKQHSFQFKDKCLPLDQAHVMGILNVTPDSFSDGGQFQTLDSALKQAEQMLSDGAAILDIGGESTRPGATPITVAQELDRVMPVIETLAKNTDAILSVDTSTPEVMLEAAKLGAHLINDVRALQRPHAIEAAAQTGLPVCLMHMQGSPKTMQQQPSYSDVVTDIENFLKERIRVCHDAGIQADQILIDPGFGFGKTVEHNLALLNRLASFQVAGLPLLVGMSRKSMIGAVLNNEVDQRLAGSLAVASAAVLQGAFIIRVHDVAPSYDVVRMLNAVRAEKI